MLKSSEAYGSAVLAFESLGSSIRSAAGIGADIIALGLPNADACCCCCCAACSCAYFSAMASSFFFRRSVKGLLNMAEVLGSRR